MSWIASNHGDEREAEQHDDEHQLSARKPEFGLSIPLHCEQVDDADSVRTARVEM